MLAYYAAVSVPRLRETTAATRWYPANFAGWQKLAVQTRRLLHAMPKGTRIVADDFKIGAELGFALRNPRIAVLPHPLNVKHGRAPQLRLVGIARRDGRPKQGPVLLVVGASEVSCANCRRAITSCANASDPCRRRAPSASTTGGSGSCCSDCRD